MPREVIYFRFLFSVDLSSLSMAEASVAIPPDVLEAARLGAIPPPEPPASGASPALPAEGVRCLHSLFQQCSAPSVWFVCYGESRLARIVLVNIHCLFCRSRCIWLLYVLFSRWVVLACKAAFLAYIIFLMFCSWPYVLSQLVSMACVAFKLPFYSVCLFRARFHSGYYSISFSQCLAF